MQLKCLKCSSATYWSRFLFKVTESPSMRGNRKWSWCLKWLSSFTNVCFNRSVLLVFVYRWKTSASHCTMRSVQPLIIHRPTVYKEHAHLHSVTSAASDLTFLLVSFPGWEPVLQLHSTEDPSAGCSAQGQHLIPSHTKHSPLCVFVLSLIWSPLCVFRMTPSASPTCPRSRPRWTSPSQTLPPRTTRWLHFISFFCSFTSLSSVIICDIQIHSHFAQNTSGCCNHTIYRHTLKEISSFWI